MSLVNRYPLLVLSIAAAAVYAVTGFNIRDLKPAEPVSAVKDEVGISEAEVPLASAPEEEKMSDAAEPQTDDEVEIIEEAPDEPGEPEVDEESDLATASPLEPVPEPVSPFETEAEAPDTEKPAPFPDTRDMPSGTVDASYFSDALFIGDSRTVGLSEYCQELDEQATFYAKISLTVKGALDSPFVKTDEGKKTVDELLGSGKQYGKIYIMLGLNEIGGGTDESFAADYKEMIDRIRQKQPQALIYIQSIMHVTKQKSDSDGHINNPRVDSRNAAIEKLADNENGIYYIDINEAVDDEDGALTASLSFDNVHLKAVSYGLWYDYLKGHAAVADGED